MQTYTLHPLDLMTLSPQRRAQYARLAPTRYHSYLQPSLQEEEIHLAIGALYQGFPVGIALAKFNTQEKGADFDFLYVDPDHRNKGIGTQLIHYLEKELETLKCFMVGLLYHTDQPTTVSLEHLLKKLHWATPENYMQRYFFDVKKFIPAWLSTVPLFPESFKKRLWKDLSETERQLLFDHYAQGHFPSPVWPWNLDSPPHPDFSFYIVEKGEILGWLIACQVSSHALNYAALFIRPEFQRNGMAIRLLIDTIQLQQTSSIPWAIFDINLRQTHPSWKKFVKLRLAPEAQQITIINRSWKSYI